MKRLTQIVNDVPVYVGAGCEAVGGSLPAEMSVQQVRDVLARLTAYEDTGLEPEEFRAYWNFFEDLISNQKASEALDYFRNLAKADKDGRVVVLPCKVGDHVFYAAGRMIVEYEIVRVFPTRTIGLATDRGYGAMNFYPYDIGRTVFLTREAAEAALKGDDHGEE